MSRPRKPASKVSKPRKPPAAPLRIVDSGVGDPKGAPAPFAEASAKDLLHYANAALQEFAIRHPDRRHFTSAARVVDAIWLALSGHAPPDASHELLRKLEKYSYDFTVQPGRKFVRSLQGPPLPKLPPRAHLDRNDAIAELVHAAHWYTDILGDDGHGKRWRPGDGFPMPLFHASGIEPSRISFHLLATVARYFPDLLPLQDSKARAKADVKLQAAIIEMRDREESVSAYELAREALIATGAGRKMAQNWVDETDRREKAH
jgi:hypothetical protein